MGIVAAHPGASLVHGARHGAITATTLGTTLGSGVRMGGCVRGIKSRLRLGIVI